MMHWSPKPDLASTTPGFAARQPLELEHFTPSHFPVCSRSKELTRRVLHCTYPINHVNITMYKYIKSEVSESVSTQLTEKLYSHRKSDTSYLLLPYASCEQ